MGTPTGDPARTTPPGTGPGPGRERGRHDRPERNILFGAWFPEGGGHLLELRDVGTYSVADDSGDVVDSGEWSLVNGRSTLRLVSGAASATCSEGDLLEMTNAGISLVFSDSPTLRVVVQRNDCVGEWGKPTWIRMSRPM